MTVQIKCCTHKAQQQRGKNQLPTESNCKIHTIFVMALLHSTAQCTIIKLLKIHGKFDPFKGRYASDSIAKAYKCYTNRQYDHGWCASGQKKSFFVSQQTYLSPLWSMPDLPNEGKTRSFVKFQFCQGESFEQNWTFLKKSVMIFVSLSKFSKVRASSV